MFAATNETITGNLTEAENRSTFDSYVNEMFATVEKAIPLLGESASVVLLSVSAKKTTSPNHSVGGSAIRPFWGSWIKELRERGIRVSAVNPGPTSTGQLNALRMSGEPSSWIPISDRPLRRSLSRHTRGTCQGGRVPRFGR